MSLIMLYMQVLQTECSVLRDGLGEFTRWVRQKIQLVEEDMDIFKVVYSLHGSLSVVKIEDPTLVYDHE